MVRTFIASLLLMSTGASALAAAPVDAQGVALVLSGGGARGLAHVGVLRILEEMRIPVDCVVGTSMGAIVGGAYAAGMSVDEMERRIDAADWTAMFASGVAREQQPFRDKQDQARNRSAIVMGYGEGRLRLPQSAIAGQGMDGFLVELAGDAEVLESFDRLPLPYRAVATDLETGEMVVLDKGALWRAMRASMAVPGVFLPIETDGRLLVDGGLVMNLPVELGRELCGPRVIAVNLGTPPHPRERLQSVTDIVLQAINLALEQNVRQQLDQLEPDDALIEVEMPDISARDFERARATIPFGIQAALRSALSLSRFSVDEQAYGEWQKRRQARWRQPAPVVADLVVDGLRSIPERAVTAGLTLRPGEPLDAESLEHDIERIYHRGGFERLRYSVLRDGPRATLRLEADERPYGLNLLRFGGGLAADFEGAGQVGLYAGYSRRWLNELGGRWDVDLQLGTINRIRSELYQPFSLDSGWFVAPSLEATQRVHPVFVDGEKLSESKERGALVGLDAGYELGAWGELRAGVRRGQRRSEVVSGLPLFPERRFQEGWLRLGAVIDRLDSPFFARRGYAARIRAEWHSPQLGSDEEYLYTELDADAALSSGANVWRARMLLAGSPDRDLPEVGRTLLGGPFRLSGYRFGEAAADQVMLVTGAYYREVGRLPDALGRGLYLGATAEWAKLHNYGDIAVLDDGVRRAYSLFFGADTVLGPLYVGGSYSPEIRSMRYYLQIGQPF